MLKSGLWLALVLGIALSAFGQNFGGEDCCCEPMPVIIEGRVQGNDFQTQNIIRNGGAYVSLVQIHRDIQIKTRLNSWGYYHFEVMSCDYVALQPEVEGKFVPVNGTVVSKPGQFFKKLQNESFYYYQDFYLAVVNF